LADNANNLKEDEIDNASDYSSESEADGNSEEDFSGDEFDEDTGESNSDDLQGQDSAKAERRRELKAARDALPVGKYLLELQGKFPSGGRPPCYDSKHLWVYPHDPVFEAKSNPFDPTPYYLPDVFIWAPHWLLDGTAKKKKRRGKESKTGIVCPNGCHAILKSHGWASNPPARNVFDISRNYYIMACRYLCPQCKKSWYLFSKEILGVLPQHVASSFPAAELRARLAISKDLLRLDRICIHNGLGPQPQSDLLREIRVKIHNLKELSFLSNALRLIQAGAWPANFFGELASSLPGDESAANPDLKKPPFSAYQDPSGYDGSHPSASFLRDVYLRYMESQAEPIHQYAGMLDFNVGKVDKSFKVRIFNH
jgi:hypothetical protein